MAKELPHALTCPKCGTILKEKIGRIPSIHWKFRKFSTKTRRAKTRMGYYYHCPKCNKDFIKTLAFVEVDIENNQIMEAYI